MPRGFTFIEMMIVIALIAILAASGILFGSRLLGVRELEHTAELMRSDLVGAQSLAQAGAGGAAWGIAFTSDRMTRFRGASFATRNPAFDVTTFFSSGITVTAPAEIIFDEEGRPNAAAVITIADASRTISITVSAAGGVTLTET